MSQADWLSHLLRIITITGQMEVRCVYGAPWRVAWARSPALSIPYHVVLKGRAVIEDPERETFKELVARSEEHTSELQSLMRISYAVFCLKKKKTQVKRLHNQIVVNKIEHTREHSNKTTQ